MKSGLTMHTPIALSSSILNSSSLRGSMNSSKKIYRRRHANSSDYSSLFKEGRMFRVPAGDFKNDKELSKSKSD